MSSRMLVEFICDKCSYVETFVFLERNQVGAVGCLDINKAAEQRGWTIGKQIGSDLLVLNYCPVCSKSGS